MFGVYEFYKSENVINNVTFALGEYILTIAKK